jgi:hypothetical protein
MTEGAPLYQGIAHEITRVTDRATKMHGMVTEQTLSMSTVHLGRYVEVLSDSCPNITLLTRATTV